jgi:hypothetical protein
MSVYLTRAEGLVCIVVARSECLRSRWAKMTVWSTAVPLTVADGTTSVDNFYRDTRTMY